MIHIMYIGFSHLKPMTKRDALLHTITPLGNITKPKLIVNFI